MKFQTGFGADAPPMIYEVDGQQYITIVTGGNSVQGSAYRRRGVDIRAERQRPAAVAAAAAGARWPDRRGPIADGVDTVRIGDNNVEYLLLAGPHAGEARERQVTFTNAGDIPHTATATAANGRASGTPVCWQRGSRRRSPSTSLAPTTTSARRIRGCTARSSSSDRGNGPADPNRVLAYLPREKAIKPPRFGICTCGNVCASIASASPIMPFNWRIYAATAYTSSSVSDFACVSAASRGGRSRTASWHRAKSCRPSLPEPGRRSGVPRPPTSWSLGLPAPFSPWQATHFSRVNRLALLRRPATGRQPGAVRTDADVPGRDLVRARRRDRARPLRERGRRRTSKAAAGATSPRRRHASPRRSRRHPNW